MRSFLVLILSAFAVCLACPNTALASGPDIDRYPLRVYIFRFNARPGDARESRRTGGMADYISGMGQADLFENGEPRGFQFTYSCVVKMRVSGRYSTVPARWKKKDKTLEILLTQNGKPEDLDACELQPVLLPEQVFFWKNGEVSMESSAALKEWMVKHKFDPEKSAEEPFLAAGESDATESPLMGPE